MLKIKLFWYGCYKLCAYIEYCLQDKGYSKSSVLIMRCLVLALVILIFSFLFSETAMT